MACPGFRASCWFALCMTRLPNASSVDAEVRTKQALARCNSIQVVRLPAEAAPLKPARLKAALLSRYS